MVFNIMCSINQFESKQLGERISTIKQDRKKQAKSYGRAQYGYINVDGKIFINKTEMAARKYAERMRLNGFSWKMVADTLYDDGVRSRKGTRLFASTLRNMFQFNPPRNLVHHLLLFHLLLLLIPFLLLLYHQIRNLIR